MNTDLLKKHIQHFIAKSKSNPQTFTKDLKERLDLIAYYRAFTQKKILSMNEEDIYEYLSKLWAMQIWGNKHYVVDKIVEENGIAKFRETLAELVLGKQKIAVRWDNFRTQIKGMGPAMISEILCKTHPDDFMLWNRLAYGGLTYLSVEKLPRYDYQLTCKVYRYLCDLCKEISDQLKIAGFDDTSLLAVDYFIYDELQKPALSEPEPVEIEDSKFIHNDIRVKLRDIGQWLGCNAMIERKVSEGSKVDVVWEATIGNMGRIIYVFEVQTKGNIDGLLLNLLKALNNPAVHGVIAVSDRKQLETIERYARELKDLNVKLKYLDYEEISKVHECLEFVNAKINNLGLVPGGF